MKDLILHLVKSVVRHPDAVTIDSKADRKQGQFIITVDPKDRGRVIGKGGRTVKAIRTVVSVLAPGGSKVSVELAEESHE